MELLHRIASADCQYGHSIYATAASEYFRVALLAETSEETLPRRRIECGERRKSGECRLKAACGDLLGG